MMKKYFIDNMKRMIESVLYIFLNYIVANIPSWTIRRLFYQLFGMHIGNGSRIYMKCIVRIPWKIKIGHNTVINENCYLDGRGGLEIGDNVSISFFSIIISASHDSKSAQFNYVKDKVVIKNNVWIGASAIILQGTVVEQACILAAGSTLKGITEAGYIYAGIPAIKMKNRDLKAMYTQNHIDFFR